MQTGDAKWWPRAECHGDGEQHCCCDQEEDCNIEEYDQ